MAPKPYHVRVKQHPGSTAQGIASEPDWAVGHEHHIGHRNRQERRPGFTNAGDEEEGDEEFKREATKELENLQDRLHKGELVNLRDVINQQVVNHRVPISNWGAALFVVTKRMTCRITTFDIQNGTHLVGDMY